MAVAAFAAALGGCVGAPTAHEATKEYYVETAGEPGATAALRLTAFPLPPAQEGAVYAVARSLVPGGDLDPALLAELLGGLEGEGEEGGVKDPPGVLYMPARPEALAASVCLVLHTAFARDLGAPRGLVEVIHHLRFLVVNRGAAPVRLDPRAVVVATLGARAAAPSSGGGDAAPGPGGPEGTPAGDEVDEVGLALLAAADADGFAVEALEVPPGEHGVLRTFHASIGSPAALAVRWRLGDPGEPAPGPTFQALLRRRYVASPGVVTELEDRVAKGLELPRARPRREPWSEPYLEPVGGR